MIEKLHQYLTVTFLKSQHKKTIKLMYVGTYIQFMFIGFRSVQSDMVIELIENSSQNVTATA